MSISHSLAMEVAMSLKKFIVDLSDEERSVCQGIIKKLKGTSQTVKRANILLKADRGWPVYTQLLQDCVRCRCVRSDQ